MDYLDQVTEQMLKNDSRDRAERRARRKMFVAGILSRVGLNFPALRPPQNETATQTLDTPDSIR